MNDTIKPTAGAGSSARPGSASVCSLCGQSSAQIMKVLDTYSFAGSVRNYCSACYYHGRSANIWPRSATAQENKYNNEGED